jgi:hypothetical protein
MSVGRWAVGLLPSAVMMATPVLWTHAEVVSASICIKFVQTAIRALSIGVIP